MQRCIEQEQNLSVLSQASLKFSQKFTIQKNIDRFKLALDSWLNSREGK